MKEQEKKDLIKECTSRMSIDIDGIPKEKCIELANTIGTALNVLKLEFTYGGIGEGLTNKICGIQFDVKDVK